MITVHGSLSPLWGLVAAVTLHALVHAGHLVENVKTRREFRRRRPAQQAAAAPAPASKETPQ